MATTLWSSTKAYTFTGPAQNTTPIDITDSGIVPNDVVMPTHITLPFTGAVVTQLAEMPKPPYTMTVSGTCTPVPTDPGGVGVGVLPMWTNAAGVIQTDGLVWFLGSFRPNGTLTFSGFSSTNSWDFPELVPPGFLGGVGANQPLTHWYWIIATADTATFTVTWTVSFSFPTPCWDSASIQTLGASGGSVVNITSSMLPPRPSIHITGVEGVGDIDAAVIPFGITDLYTTCSLDARPAGSDEIDVYLLTFTPAGTLSRRLVIGTFTSAIPAWLRVSVTPLATEAYWYVYIYNADSTGGRIAAASMRYYCSGGGATASGGMTMPLGLAGLMARLIRRGRSFAHVIGD